MSQLHILSLPKYGRLGASSRLRSIQYSPWLRDAGLDVEIQPLLADEMLKARYADGGYATTRLLRRYGRRVALMLRRRAFDLLWIEKEALPWLPLWFELSLLRGVPYALDYDDAVFHSYDLHPSALVRRVYGKRLDGLMRRAALVVAGNEYLARRARDAGARWVEVLPTVIDLDRYNHASTTKSSQTDHIPRVVWIGSPATVHYLQLVQEALRHVAEKMPFVLRIVGGGRIHLPGVRIEAVPWTEETEEESIATAEIGIMPLVDSPWERGKCGYKLIQYMACGLPVIASPIGVNSEIVQSGLNGLLVSSQSEWAEGLLRLLGQPETREAMGRNGRERVIEGYCIQRTGPKLAELLRQAARGN